MELNTITDSLQGTVGRLERRSPVKRNGNQLTNKRIDFKEENKMGDNNDKVIVTFTLTADEARRVCALRFEPKVATAAAQIVRMVINGKQGN